MKLKLSMNQNNQKDVVGFETDNWISSQIDTQISQLDSVSFKGDTIITDM